MGFDALPDAGFSLLGWSPDCAGGVVIMTADRVCTPTFGNGGPPPPPPPPPPPTPGLSRLTIVVSGNGTILGPAIVCGNGGSACSVEFPTGATIGFDVMPAPGSSFLGWSGPGCGSLIVLNGDMTCTATFSGAAPELSGAPTVVSAGPTPAPDALRPEIPDLGRNAPQ